MEDDIALVCLQVPQIAPGKRNVGWGVGRGVWCLFACM